MIDNDEELFFRADWNNKILKYASVEINIALLDK